MVGEKSPSLVDRVSKREIACSRQLTPSLLKFVTAVEDCNWKQEIAILQGSNWSKRLQTLVRNPHLDIVRRREQLHRGDRYWKFSSTWQVFSGINLFSVRRHESTVVRCARWREITAEPPSAIPRHWQRWRINPHGILWHVFRPSRRKHDKTAALLEADDIERFWWWR